MESSTIETFGKVSKIETLHSIDHNIIPNTLVLETIEPFPGYYEWTVPDDISPRSLFIITKKNYSMETILRACQRIQEFGCYRCSFTYAEIIINNTRHTGIRIRNLDAFTKIPGIQEAFIKEEFELKHHKNIHAPAFIHISKTFLLEEEEEGIYKDLEEEDMYYIEIHTPIKWNEFDGMTQHVKNNISNRSFDAAQALIYRKHGIVDLIRIYDKKIDKERGKNIRTHYLEEIRKHLAS